MGLPPGMSDERSDRRNKLAVAEKIMRVNTWRAVILGCLFSLPMLFGAVPESADAEMKPAAAEGFQHYVQATEARIQRESAHPDAFLYIDELTEPRRSQVRESVKHGEIFMERLETRDASGAPIGAPGGLI